MQRISLDAADLVDEMVLQDSLSGHREVSPEEIAVISRLKQRGFLSDVYATHSLAFSADWAYPKFPVLRTLSIDFDGNSTENINQFVEFAIACNSRMGMPSVVIFVSAGGHHAVAKAVDTLIGRSNFIVVTLIVQETQLTKFRAMFKHISPRVQIVAAPLSNIPGHRSSRPPAVSKSSFFCRQDYYHLLCIASESYGCLHVDKYGDIYPETMEVHHKVGHITSLSLDSIESLIDSSVSYWRTGKSEREKCSDCEYRFVCPNSLAARKNKENLLSEPTNCSYLPDRGIWT